MAPLKWTDEEKEYLRTLAKVDKLGTTEIAHRLTEKFERPFNRAMVKGQADRMGIKINVTNPQQAKALKAKRTMPAAPSVPLWALGLGLKDLPATACTIFDLKIGRCKFPMWPSELKASSHYPYCGAKANGSWCEKHQRIVYPRRDPR